MNFNERIKCLRDESRLTQEELADKLNVKRATVTSWESHIVPDIDKLIAISRFFDCSIDYLVGRDNNRNPKSVNDFTSDEQKIASEIIKHLRKDVRRF